MEEEINRCKCGRTPDVCIRIRLTEPQYQAWVECPECGESVCGVQWHWSKDPAVDDAIEEWNKAMPEVENDR